MAVQLLNIRGQLFIINCLFWQKLFLGIPVTSGYIESFFSKTGFIMRPHRRCMGDDFAENLFYCKENLNLL